MVNYIITIKKTILLILYMTIGPSLILLNKYILYILKFPYPMALAGMGIFTSGTVAQLLVKYNWAKIECESEVQGILYFKRVFPVGLSYAATLTLGNYVYLYLDVSIIQMLKCFSPVLVMLGLYLTKIEIPKKSTILAIMIISFGTLLTCNYAPNASMFGLFIMLSSEIFEAIRLILTQFLLKNVNMSVIEGQYYLSPISACFLFFCSLIFEFPNMIRDNSFEIVYNNPYHFIGAAVLGMIINYLGFFVIQVASSLSLKVLILLIIILLYYIIIFIIIFFN